ncbi:hypothetical protein ACFX2G_024883 [Malus domestica]
MGEAGPKHTIVDHLEVQRRHERLSAPPILVSDLRSPIKFPIKFQRSISLAQEAQPSKLMKESGSKLQYAELALSKSKSCRCVVLKK